MFARDMGTPRPKEYVSPDGSLFLPAARVFGQGPPDAVGWRFSDDLDAYGFVTALPGTRVYVSNESEDRTYSGLVAANGAVTDLKLFAERGGESRRDRRKRQVFHRQWPGVRLRPGPAGRSVVSMFRSGPLQILFGGEGHRTLFILSHHALFAVNTKG